MHAYQRAAAVAALAATLVLVVGCRGSRLVGSSVEPVRDDPWIRTSDESERARAPSPLELQSVIEAQQRQLETQQRQLQEQRRVLLRLRAEVDRIAERTDGAPAGPPPGKAAAPSPSVAQTPPPPPPPASVPATRHLSAPLPARSVRDRFSSQGGSSQRSPAAVASSEPRRLARGRVSQASKYDTAPTSVDLTYFDPQALINIPGTKTSIGLHGFAMFQMIYDTSGPDGNQFDTAFIPVDGTAAETKFNVNPSRIFFSSTTEVCSGQVNTLISMDFNDNVNTPEPRLRIAYGEYVNEARGFSVLAGQSIATMTDVRAVPEVLDFAVPAGLFAARQPMLRFTNALRRDFLMEASFDTPQNVRYIDADKQTRLPDLSLTGAWLTDSRYLRHARVAVLARDLRAGTPSGASDSAFGWAVQASTKVSLPFLGPKDNLRLSAHVGEGYGSQLKGGPEEAVFNPTTSRLDLIGIWSVIGGIQHSWSESFRSNLNLGHLSADNPASAPSDALAETTYVSANLIWNPFKRVTLGVEWLWGRREDFDGASGTSNRLLFSSRFDF